MPIDIKKSHKIKQTRKMSQGEHMDETIKIKTTTNTLERHQRKTALWF